MARFELYETEWAAFKSWNEKHLAEYHNGQEPYSGCIGGRISFEFVGTSLGDVVIVRCNMCKWVDKRKRVPPKETYEANITDWKEFG